MKRFGIGVCLFVMLACVGIGVWGVHELRQPLKLANPTEQLHVPSGSAFSTVVTHLQQQGWIEYSLFGRLYARFNPEATQIKAGTYRIELGITLSQLLQKLVEGDVVSYSITLIEGWTFKQVLARLESTQELDHILSGQSTAEIMNQLSLSGEHPEGLFFPDTYSFQSGSTDLDVLRRANKRLQAVLAQEWAERSENLPLKTPYEALILASIVEKETGAKDERKVIAGVFARRMKIKMRLQTDPTVIYGLGDSYKGNLTRAHLRAATPYNTYRISGLPPTPIAMPGARAINAVMHPAQGKSLYFVAKGDGSHQFSETLEQHNRAVREYQLRRKAGYRSSPK